MATHWKKATDKDPNFIGSHDLFIPETESYGEKVVTVTGCGFEWESVQGSKKQVRLAKFKECKPLILNATNCKVLAKLFGTPVLENWHGKQITLYVEKGVRFGGDYTDAIRIRPAFAVVQLPKMGIDHKHYAITLEKIGKGEGTVELLETKFNLTPEAKEALTNAEKAYNDGKV